MKLSSQRFENMVCRYLKQSKTSSCFGPRLLYARKKSNFPDFQRIFYQN